MSHLNTQIKEAIDSFDINHARELLRVALKEPNADTYYLASKVAIDDDQKQEFLQKAIALDPSHSQALKTLMPSNKQTSDNVRIPPPPQNIEHRSQSNANNSQKIDLPTAIVQNSGVVYTVPHSKGTQRTTLTRGSQVQAIARDSRSNWINVTYLSSVGQRVFGWMIKSDLGPLTYLGQPASYTDLAISELNFNSRSEVEHFAGRFNRTVYMMTFGILMTLSMMPWLLILFSADEPDAAFVVIMTSVQGLFVILTILGWKLRSVPQHGFSASQLTAVIKSRKSSTELSMEHQQNMMLMNIAGNMATRMVPNKQDINIRHR